VAERGPVALLTAVRPETRRTLRQALCAVGFGLCVWAFLAVAAVRHGYFDLRVYYGALNYWVHGGGQLYDYLLPRSEYGFTYPPFAALMMLPMAYLGWRAAIAVSLVLSVGAALLLLHWFVGPIIRRRRWTPWFAMAIVVGLAAALEPVRETINFGQVNLVLLFLVAADLLFLVRYKHRFGGIGIGLATAIKLTPGIFIVYLLVTRRFRAAAVASATAAAATWLAATFAPDASRVFWTDSVWNTDRVGSPTFVSNQSLNGLVARLDPTDPSSLLWLALVVATLLVWAWRSRRAAAAGDELTGLALTGIAGCLISPFTWVHHLVWVLPALALLFDHALDQSNDAKRRRRLMIFAIGSYVLLCSRLVWALQGHFTGLGLFTSNAYTLLQIALLVALPLREPADAASAVPGPSRPTVEDVPDLVEIDRRVTAAFDAKDAGLPVEEPELAGPSRPLVGAEP
jgi:alpha-1,2-mannosyltransferase